MGRSGSRLFQYSFLFMSLWKQAAASVEMISTPHGRENLFWDNSLLQHTHAPLKRQGQYNVCFCTTTALFISKFNYNNNIQHVKRAFDGQSTSHALHCSHLNNNPVRISLCYYYPHSAEGGWGWERVDCLRPQELAHSQQSSWDLN